MKRKVIKRLTMLSLVSIFTLCAAVASANAQLSIPVRAKIPFDFSVGDKKLPAGDYTLSHLSGFSTRNLISVGSVDATTYQLTVATEVLIAKNKSTLVFHKYGDHYFLAQIWLAGEREGTQVPESRTERTLRRQLAQTQQSKLSGNVMEVESIEIAASSF